MSIVRKSEMVSIPGRAIADSTITATEFRVLCWLCATAGPDRSDQFPIPELNETGYRFAVSELAKAGYLRMRRMGDDIECVVLP